METGARVGTTAVAQGICENPGSGESCPRDAATVAHAHDLPESDLHPPSTHQAPHEGERGAALIGLSLAAAGRVEARESALKAADDAIRRLVAKEAELRLLLRDIADKAAKVPCPGAAAISRKLAADSSGSSKDAEPKAGTSGQDLDNDVARSGDIVALARDLASSGGDSWAYELATSLLARDDFAEVEIRRSQHAIFELEERFAKLRMVIRELFRGVSSKLGLGMDPSISDIEACHNNFQDAAWEVMLDISDNRGAGSIV